MTSPTGGLQPHPLPMGSGTPLQLSPGPAVLFKLTQGSVRASGFPREGYSDWLGGQGPLQQHRPRGRGQWVSQFYLKRRGMMKLRTLDGAPGSGGKHALIIQDYFFPGHFDLICCGLLLVVSLYFWPTVADPFSFLCQSCCVRNTQCHRVSQTCCMPLTLW